MVGLDSQRTCYQPQTAMNRTAALKRAINWQRIPNYGQSYGSDLPFTVKAGLNNTVTRPTALHYIGTMIKHSSFVRVGLISSVCILLCKDQYENILKTC